MAELDVAVSTKKIILMHASFIVDILFGFIFFFLLPKLLTKRQLFIVLNAFNLIIFISCLYSLVKERTYYFQFLSGDWSYSSDTIGSFFGNKQQWGIFLIPAIPSLSLSAYYIGKERINVVLKTFLVVAYLFVVLIVMFCGTVAFCKTAIVCSAVFVMVIVLGFTIHMLKNKKTVILSIFFFGCFAGIIAYVICIMNIPFLQSTKIGKIVSTTINTLFSSGEGSLLVRLELVYLFLQNFPSTNIMFGITKGLVDPYVRALMPELIVGLHTGYAIYFGRTGVIGFVIFAILNVYIFRGMALLSKKKPFLSIVLFASYLSSVGLSLSESEILIFSSSMNGFIFNLILVTCTLKESNNYDEVNHEKTIPVIC